VNRRSYAGGAASIKRILIGVDGFDDIALASNYGQVRDDLLNNRRLR